MHRAKVLVEHFAVAGPYAFNAPRLQLLVKGVPEVDAIYLAEERRYGGRPEMWMMAASRPSPRQAVLMRLCLWTSHRKRTSALANGNSYRCVQWKSAARRPRTPRLRQPGGRCATPNTSDVTAERFVLDNLTLTQLLGGSGKANRDLSRYAA